MQKNVGDGYYPLVAGELNRPIIDIVLLLLHGFC